MDKPKEDPKARGPDSDAEAASSEAQLAKRDPFVTLRIVIIIVVPLILILVLTDLDKKFFSIFASDEQPKVNQPSDDAGKSASGNKSDEPYRLPRTNTPPP